MSLSNKDKSIGRDYYIPIDRRVEILTRFFESLSQFIFLRSFPVQEHEKHVIYPVSVSRVSAIM